MAYRFAQLSTTRARSDWLRWAAVASAARCASAAYAAPLFLLAGNRAAVHVRATLEHAAAEADLEEQQIERLISAGKESLKHLTEVAERTLAIEESLQAQDLQLLRMEKATLAFERDRSVHRAVGKARATSALKSAEGKSS